jgi:tRNA-Thr(GGU) m(6)t(6)A37 methyltransferase TsaA
MSDNNNSITLDYIGHVESPFKEKFAIPRQPGLVNGAQGKVILTGDANNADLVKELEQFSHIWLLFVFHGTQAQGWKPLVRPPRLGGNKKIGVLATRSTFRPNPIGMSVVKLISVKMNNQQVILNISGIDLLDQTPIVDIKPYVPYSDALPDAVAGFAQTQPDTYLSIVFNKQARLSLAQYEQEHPGLTQLIEQVLAQDPRPAYKRDKVDNKVYGMSLYDLNIEWQMQDLSNLLVIRITKYLSASS